MFRSYQRIVKSLNLAKKYRQYPLARHPRDFDKQPVLGLSVVGYAWDSSVEVIRAATFLCKYLDEDLGMDKPELAYLRHALANWSDAVLGGDAPGDQADEPDAGGEE